jgi:hypothetical protein
MSGRQVAITRDMLTAIQANYAPDFHEAKLTKDHQTGGEAVGRISNVRLSGDRLIADFADLSPETAKSMTRRGVWNNRSSEIALNMDGKGPYLKNVSLLSARPPAIKVMARIEPNQIVLIAAFSEPEGTATYTYYFEEVEMPDNPTPSAEIIALSEENKQKDIALAEAQAKIANLTAKADKVDRLEQIVLASQAEIARANAKEFISLYPRRITPALKDIALACLCPDSNGDILLSESDGKTSKVSSADAFKAFITALPDFGPALKTELAAGAASAEQNLSDGLTADELAFAERLYPKDSALYKSHIENMKKEKGGKA